MGNIREYTNKIDGLDLNDRASSAAAEAGRATGRAYNDIGNSIQGAIKTGTDLYQTYEAHKAREEISQGIASSAQITNNLSQSWDAVANSPDLDPNDNTVAERWREENLNPILDDWVNSFGTEAGKTWAIQQVAQVREHFFEKTAADQATLAGAAAVKNVQDFSASASNNAETDPTAVPMLLNTADQMVQAVVQSHPHLTPAQAAKVRTDILAGTRAEILKGGFIGMARANPDQALAKLDAGYGKTDLDATEVDTLRKYAEAQKAAKLTAAKAATAEQKAARVQEYKTGLTAFQLSMFNKDGTVIPNPKMATQLVDFSMKYADVADPGEIRSIMNANETAIQNSINRTNVRTDPATWQALASRLVYTIDDPRTLTDIDVNKAYAAGALSNKDFQFLSGAVQSAQSNPAETHARSDLNNAIDRVKGLIDHSNIFAGKLDNSGIAYYAQFHYDVWTKYQGLIASGKTPAEAVQFLEDPKNPQSLYNMVPKYQKSGEAVLKDMRGGRTPLDVQPLPGPPGVNPTGPATVDDKGRVVLHQVQPMPPPRKPNESPADYLKRTGH